MQLADRGKGIRDVSKRNYEDYTKCCTSQLIATSVVCHYNYDFLPDYEFETSSYSHHRLITARNSSWLHDSSNHSFPSRFSKQACPPPARGGTTGRRVGCEYFRASVRTRTSVFCTERVPSRVTGQTDMRPRGRFCLVPWMTFLRTMIGLCTLKTRII